MWHWGSFSFPRFADCDIPARTGVARRGRHYAPHALGYDVMFGCAMALLWEDERFNRWVEKLLNPTLFAFSAFSL